MRQLTDQEIVAVLVENGVGVLALDGRERPYPLPVTFGYEPKQDMLVFQLEGDDDSEKHDRLERNSTVGFAVYEETEPGERWRSVVVDGELVEITFDEAEPALATLAKNTQFAPNPLTWGDAATVQPFQLRIDDWSGREFEL
jgi:nitroimidazol reductase NimA-like FMN-containing flavoprotein (pyridoxamine 5'-phosphate oxidase superfamily)